MKKLLLSIIAVVVTVAALGTSTFAWFTLSNKASVGEFTANVTAGEGIEISIDSTNWYTDIPESVMQDHIDAKGVIFKDITSTNGIAFSRLFGPAIDPLKDYYEVTVYFRSAVATNIYWTNTTLGGVDVPWTPDATFDYRGAEVSSAAAITVNPSSAARISVTKVDGSTAFVFEKAASTGINDYMGAKAVTTGALPTDNGSINYYNAKNDTDITAAQYNAAVLPTTFSTFDATVVANNNLIATTVAGNVATSVTVRVWIEGWDSDTFNAILGQALVASLKFEGVTIA